MPQSHLILYRHRYLRIVVTLTWHFFSSDGEDVFPSPSFFVSFFLLLILLTFFYFPFDLLPYLLLLFSNSAANHIFSFSNFRIILLSFNYHLQYFVRLFIHFFVYFKFFFFSFFLFFSFIISFISFSCLRLFFMQFLFFPLHFCFAFSAVFFPIVHKRAFEISK